MWLNQQTFDAVRIMVALAERWPNLARAQELSQATGVTLTNIQKTSSDLGQACLIEAVRGRAGGVRLIRSPEQISVGSIVRVFEPKDCPANFLTVHPRDRAISDVLFKAHRGFFQPLEQTWLSELVGWRMSQPPGGLNQAAAIGMALAQ
jgi:Rrf2 family nitric oxide-sensitive transcriptional repressor